MSPGVIVRRYWGSNVAPIHSTDATIAVFADHGGAEDAVKKLAAAGFDIKDLSVVGKGYHTDEKVVGFYNLGDKVKFWGTRGAFRGAMWGLFFGGLFLPIPVVGHVVVPGYLAIVMISAVDTAIMTGGLSALGAAVYGLGIPKNSALEYETAIKADSFLVSVHGNAEEMARAKTILQTTSTRVDIHGHNDDEESASSGRNRQVRLP